MPPARPLRPSPGQLADAVRVDAVLAHLRALQAIADAHGGTRASGTAGYDASVDYLAARLAAAGYAVARQPFDFPYYHETAPPTFAQVSPSAVTYVPGEDYTTLTFSGAGDVTAPVQAVSLTIPPTDDPRPTSGCDRGDLVGFVPGRIALIQRGTCPLRDKVLNAQRAGAAAVILMNLGLPGWTERLAGSLIEPGVTIPVVGVSYEIGVALAQGAVARVAVRSAAPIRATCNLLAQTATGRTDNVVLAGAHLDAMPPVSPASAADFASPAINAAGSGPAALLEIALQLAGATVDNAVRFAWWGAGEPAQLGAAQYVGALSPAELTSIGAYLDASSLASPNGVYGVYDGDDSDQVGGGPGPLGSDRLESVVAAAIDRLGRPHVGADLSGRSDYQPFAQAGVAVGGLFSGAEELKTPAEAQAFGGRAGEPYDPSYHTPADTYPHLDPARLAVNCQALAAVVAALAGDVAALDAIHPPGAPRHASGEALPGAPSGSIYY